MCMSMTFSRCDAVAECPVVDSAIGWPDDRPGPVGDVLHGDVLADALTAELSAVSSVLPAGTPRSMRGCAVKVMDRLCADTVAERSLDAVPPFGGQQSVRAEQPLPTVNRVFCR